MRTEDQHKQMHQKLSEEREGISPDTAIKQRLDSAFESRHKSTPVVALWLNYPVPAWQVAACVALLVVSGILLGRKKEHVQFKEVLAMADTVYVEKMVPGKTDTVIMEKTVRISQNDALAERPKDQYTDSSAPSVSYGNPTYMNPGINIADFHNLQPNGSPLSEDSAAQSWMGKIL